MMTDAQRDAVVAEAATWLRTPWHHRAMVKGGGVDCAHLPYACYLAAGVMEPFQLPAYPPDWMLHRDREWFLEVVTEHMDRVAEPRRGDLVVWKYGRCFSHGGIITTWPRFIHAHKPERMVTIGDATQGQHKMRPMRFFTPRVGA